MLLCCTTGFALTAEWSPWWLTCIFTSFIWSFLSVPWYHTYFTILVLFFMFSVQYLIYSGVWYLYTICLHFVLFLSSCPSTPSVFSSGSCPRGYSDPQSSERMEAERSEQGLQFHLPLSFRPKPPRIALQAVKERWTSREIKQTNK